MDFFGRQGAARRHSRLLLVGFLLAMAGTAAVVHLAVATVSLAFGQSSGWAGALREPSPQALALTGVIWTTVLLGALFRWLDVRAGGATLARRFGATPVADASFGGGAAADDTASRARARDPATRALAHVVAEVAIAASCPPPAVWLLPHESSINAFVVGTPGRQPALVLTRGALDALDRDELRAVVAHEIAHVVQGDLPLNMRLLIALGGLGALDEVGRTLIGQGSDRTVHPGTAVGWLLRALGAVGTVSGGLLRAALSRRRELLADATAVQYTRQPLALASALATIEASGESVALHSPRLPELAHLCFHGGARPAWYRRLLAAHPPIRMRIDAIDPHFAVKRRKRDGDGATAAPVPSVVGGTASRHGASGTGGGDIGGGLVSDRIALLVSDGPECLAALCALFVPPGAGARRDYLGALTFVFDRRLAKRVEALLDALAPELADDRLGLIEHASGVLRGSVALARRRQFLLKLERLIGVGGELDLATYAALRLIRRKLDAEFPVLETLAEEGGCAEGRRIKSFEAMGEELALLLSLMVESSGAAPEVLEREFRRVLGCYTGASLPRRSRDESGIVAELERAFQTLYVQPKPIRRAFVQHCIEIMESDGRVVGAERALLGLFAAALGCEELAA